MEKASHISPTQWMHDSRVHAVLQSLSLKGGQAKFVGGCVRDTLLGRRITDLDVATDVEPSTTLELLKSAGIKALPTGLDHGTVMAVYEGLTIEITTLRKDVKTFGRKAEVAFTDDWTEDAKRRDFTMNALYLDLDGTVYDPCAGLEDLKQGRVRFIGEASERIQEDYLRILRYFRFLATHAKVPANEDDLRACEAYAPQIETLSRERIQVELKKLLCAANPTPTLKLMITHSIMAHTLSHIPETKHLPKLIELENSKHANPSFLRRLACMFGLDATVLENISSELRLANKERQTLNKMCCLFETFPDLSTAYAATKILHENGRDFYTDLILVTASLNPGIDLDNAWKRRENWAAPSFPLSGKDLENKGFIAGPDMGNALAKVKDWWFQQEGKPTKDQCLEWLTRNKV